MIRLSERQKQELYRIIHLGRRKRDADFSSETPAEEKENEFNQSNLIKE